MYRIQGIIFDMDGTLVELPVDWREVIRRVNELLGVRVEMLLELFPRLWGTEKYGIVSRIIEDFEMASLSNLKILDDSPKLLRRLSSKYQLGLVTFQSANVARKVIEKMDVNLQLIATRDDSPTRAEQISMIVSASHLEFEDFLVVGDMLNDVYSALQVGCHAVLVNRYGRYDFGGVEKGFAVIRNLKELCGILQF